MKRQYVSPAMLELRAAINEAEELSKKPEVTKRDETRINFLMAKMAALRAGHVASDNSTERWFRSFVKNELRASMQEGTQTPVYTQGPEGGYVVPNEFHDEVILGMAQFDPLLNRDVVTLIESGDGSLRPYTIPGWDLSSFAAVKVAEGVQQSPQTPPSVSGKMLNGYKYMASVPVSFELEEDAFEPMKARISEAFSIGMARGIGVDLITGNGTSAPQGITVGASDSGVVSANVGKLVGDDIENIYFSVDRFYRSSPKCAWAMNDATYQKVRKMVDDNHRPLINIVNDQEVLLGKPIQISPSMDSSGHAIIFGDLSHFMVRVSRLSIKRSTQAPGYIDKGQALYTGIMRADAVVFDPTSGSKPPIVFAGLHS